jgi:RNA polymerase sigma-70 factor (ECF subfamily)
MIDGFPLNLAESGTTLSGMRIGMRPADPRTETCDNDLVALAIRGHVPSFKELVERYRQRAYLFAMGMVHNSDDASDLSQEAFVRVYKHLSKFDNNYPFRVWLFHILANLCRNHLRQRKTHGNVVVATDDEKFLTAVDRRDPEMAMGKAELQAQVWKAIGLLPEKFREIIILSHFQEMTYDQMAEALEIPRGSVMSRLYYARVRLREILENMGVEL